MRVSVVIPAYNEEHYIADCLNHINHQIEKPYEVIVVDNNSTDNTAKIATKMGARVVVERKQGMIMSRNAGFDAATGEVIARCDADTLVPPHWIRRIKYNFDKKNIDALTGPLMYYDLPVKNVMPVFNTYLVMISKMIKHHPLHGPNMALTKSIWNRVRSEVCLDDSQVHEDHDLSLHIHQMGGVIAYDRYLTVKTSGRRIKKDPVTFFVEYPMRIAKTMRKHHIKLIDL